MSDSVGFKEISIVEDGEKKEKVSFDICLIVDKDNKLKIIDSEEEDWTGYVDSTTLAVKNITINIK